MSTKVVSPKPRDAFGLEHHSLVAGAFYQCVQPGGFTDSLTGIHIPGPKARVDESNRREIISFADIPEPVQLPHFKLVVEMSEGGKMRKEVEVVFNAQDEQPVHEAFQLALSTGIIRLVPDDVMEQYYRETWEGRKEKIIWRAPNAKQERPARDLLDEAQEGGEFLRVAQNAKKMAEAKETMRKAIAKQEAPREEDDEPDEKPRKAPPKKAPPKIKV